MRLEGKVCLITGAGTGIGRVLATTYADAGATVILAARRTAPLEETADLVLGRGGHVHTHIADVRDEQSCRELVSFAIERAGRLDVLLNNAAIPGTDQPVSSMTRENWDDTIATNLTGPMLLSREALSQAMVPAGSGNIQFFSSGAAKTTPPSKAHYVVAKLGLIGLARTLSVEVGALGIRVNTLVIGSVAGELVDGWLDRVSSETGRQRSQLLEQLTASAALKRLVRPEEVAATSVWLASDDASAITGQDINVTAGAEKR